MDKEEECNKTSVKPNHNGLLREDDAAPSLPRCWDLLLTQLTPPIVDVKTH